MWSFAHPRFRRARRSASLALALSAGVTSACSPPLPGVAPREDAGVAEGTASPNVPPGGLCAPTAAPVDPGLPPDAGGDDAGACSDVDAGTAFAPGRPVGVGYTDGDDPLPAHVAYLTFDDGPSDWTNTFLDVLASRGVKGTFFVTARQLKGSAGLDGTFVDDTGATVAYRDELQREAAEGHAIGSHTVNHPDLGGIGEEQIQAELDENELLMNAGFLRAGGVPHVLTLFRPPYGSPWFEPKAPAGGAVVAAGPIARHGFNVLWTLDSTDSLEWAQDESYSRTEEPVRGADPPTYAAKAQRVRDSVLTDPSVLAGQGAVILMHDTHDTTRDVLPDIIDGLTTLGYSFDTIEDYVLQRWNRPSADLTPGPSLYQGCVDAGNAGCAAFGVPVGTDRAREVCGRMWLAYQAFGGVDVVGAPVAAPTELPGGGGASQAFEKATIELHPENAAPCNFVLLPR